MPLEGPESLSTAKRASERRRRGDRVGSGWWMVDEVTIGVEKILVRD